MIVTPASAPVLSAAPTPAPVPSRSAWLVALSYDYGWEHGGHLRTFAIAREWVRRGAEVTFVALRPNHAAPARTRAYLEGLRDAGIITGFDEIELPHARVRGKLARAALHPAARDALLRAERQALITELDAVARRRRPELIVSTARQLLFAADHLRRHHAPVVVDWRDSLALYHRRMRRAAVARRAWRTAAAAAFEAWETGLEEGYYARRVDCNVMVSPVDGRMLRQLAGPEATVRAVPNGLGTAVAWADDRARVPGRLVFSGNMDFPPNYSSAMWFIAHVLPRIVAECPDVRLVVAGANPVPELRALAGPHVEVTGFVDDMRAEIGRSALYVAPMTSGSGFKNKVVEALATGTHVVGTSYAFEFLPDDLRALFSPADDPAALADAVLRALADPARSTATVEQFWALARDRYDWACVADQFAREVSPAGVNHSAAAA